MRLQLLTEVELPEDYGSFQEAEAKVKEAVFVSGQQLMGELMRMYEAAVLERKQFWKKDLKRKRFQTLVGAVPMRRWRVWDWKEQRHRYPLDEWLQIRPQEKATPALQQAIVQTCVQRSYRQASKEVEHWTGVKRSPMTNWKLIQQVAEAGQSKEPVVPDWYLKPLPSLDPRLEDPCPILAIDPDATYCHNQDGLGKDHEVKMAVLYTGKEPEDGKKKRWRLVNKQIFFSRSGETVREFHSRVTQMAMSHYGAHRQTRIVIHGDGDPWIKSLKTNYWDQAVIRLDPWHVMKKIRLATGLREAPSEWKGLIYGHPDRLVSQLQGFKLLRTAPHSPERQKMQELIGYLKNNRDGLLPSGVPPEIKVAYPRMFIRGSGTIESNVGHLFNARFKQARMSWSPRGLDNLSYLRERYLNGTSQPRYKVPQPLTRKIA
jgi:hypothetical protein